MTILFRYKGHKVSDGTIFRPEIPVRLGHKGRHQDVIALIDSGADSTAIPKGLAEFLELDLSGKRHQSKGIGGNVEVVESKMDVLVSDMLGREKHSLHSLSVQVNLSDDEGAFILLGRRGFFEEFEITFKEREKKMLLKEAPADQF